MRSGATFLRSTAVESDISRGFSGKGPGRLESVGGKLRAANSDGVAGWGINRTICCFSVGECEEYVANCHQRSIVAVLKFASFKRGQTRPQ
jgi:hypothetical protein